MGRARFLCGIISMFLAYIICGDAFAQISVPNDDGSMITIEAYGNDVYISGIVINRDAPVFTDVLAWNSPCASLTFVNQSNCENPEINGYRAIAYYIHLIIEFDKGCDGKMALWAKTYPAAGIIYVDSDQNFHIGRVEIRDDCGVPIKMRSMPSSEYIDRDERIGFYVQLRSAEEEPSFPSMIQGNVNTDITTEVNLGLQNQNGGIAEYWTEAQPAGNFLGDEPYPNPGPLVFTFEHTEPKSYAIAYEEIDFTLEELVFEENILINYTGPGTGVCQPWDSYLTLGGKFTVGRDSWPDDCRNTCATMIPYHNSLQFAFSTGEVMPEWFITDPAQSDYYVPGGMEFGYEDLLLDPIRISVNDGKERFVAHGSETVRVYRGFRAGEILPLNIGPLEVGQQVTVYADPEPTLLVQDRILYDWRFTPVDGGNGEFLNTILPGSWVTTEKANIFRATVPGRVNLYYIIRDVYSGTNAESPHKIVSIAPEITITAPPTQPVNKFSFNDELPNGVITIGQYAATTGNPILDNLIEWSITPIVGSSEPQSGTGPTMTFTFTGLPWDNNQFGSKVIRAILSDYNKEATVTAYIYYEKTATNNPDTIHDWPNWYYYWSQTPAYVNESQEFGGEKCYPGRKGYYDPEAILFHVCNPAGFYNQIQCDNNNWWGGIDSFGAAELHESTHLADWWTFWPNGYIQSADMDPPTPEDTTWGDDVPDYLEGPGHQYPGLDPSRKDSDGDTFFDFDDFGYDAECNWLEGNADTEDWGKPGHQF